MLKVAFAQAPVAMTPITQANTVPQGQSSIAKTILLLLGLTLLGLLYTILLPLLSFVTLGWIARGTGWSISPEEEW
jgi:hypothetical protein